MRLLFSLMFILFATLCHSATIQIHIKNPDGTPAVGIPIQQIGLTWRHAHNKLEGKTDRSGSIKITFEEKVWDVPVTFDSKEYRKVKMGYDIYRFVIMPTRFRWEISDIYYYDFQPPEGFNRVIELDEIKSINQQKFRGEPHHFQYGKVMTIQPGETVEWNIQLKKGPRKTITMLDQFDQPIPNFNFDVSVGFQDYSRVGGGITIPVASITTDPMGRFQLDNVGDFLYHISSSNYFQYYSFDPYERNGWEYAWLTSDNPKVHYKKALGHPLTVIAIDIETGKGIPEAYVTEVLHFPAMTQGGPRGRTDENGFYTCDEFNTDHVVQFGVWKEGYKSQLLKIDQYTPGGKYTFELEREKK